MTADVILLTEAQVLTDDIRQSSLIWLARECAEKRHDVVMAMLGQWAHPSLDAKRRAYLFADYRECAERASALAGGVACWTEFYDEGDLNSPGCDPHGLAIELLGDRADEALFELIHGGNER